MVELVVVSTFSGSETSFDSVSSSIWSSSSFSNSVLLIVDLKAVSFQVQQERNLLRTCKLLIGISEKVSTQDKMYHSDTESL